MRAGHGVSGPLNMTAPRWVGYETIGVTIRVKPPKVARGPLPALVFDLSYFFDGPMD